MRVSVAIGLTQAHACSIVGTRPTGADRACSRDGAGGRRRSADEGFLPPQRVISLVVSLAGGGTVDVAMVGHDSILGGSAALDGSISLTDAIVAGRSFHP
jgi:hypothetical protein